MKRILLAEFTQARDLVAAASMAMAAGHVPMDVLSPIPVDALDKVLPRERHRTPTGWIMFAAGCAGAILGYAVQWFSAVVDYPINSGGRALHSWPAFLLVPYETTILFAAIAGVVSWLLLCGLPRLHHVLFSADAVEGASQDRYMLVFADSDGLNTWIADTLHPRALHEVET